MDLDVVRGRAGISLEHIAATTKISMRFLSAIEAEEFEKLPGGIFTVSYLKQYAAAVGYDESALLAHYHRKMNPQPLEAEPDRPSGTGRLLYRWLGMAQAPQ